MTTVSALRNSAIKGPLLPFPEERKELMALPYYRRPWLERDTPPWVRPFSCLRDKLYGAGIRFGPNETDPWFLFVYAMQNPQEVTLLPLMPHTPWKMSESLSFDASVAVSHLYHRRLFVVSSGSSYYHEFMDTDLTGNEDIFVLPSLLVQSGGFFASHVDPMPLDLFLGQFHYVPLRAVASNAREAAERASVRDAALHPCLADHLKKRETMAKRRRVDAMPKSIADDTIEPLDEEELREVHGEVDAIRAAWLNTHGDRLRHLTHFMVEHRGGKWTRRYKKISVDVIRGKPCTAAGKRFLKSWGMTGSFSCDIKAYTLAVAQSLALAWCHRMSYFMQVWEDHSYDPNFEFGHNEVEAYEEESILERELNSIPPGGIAAVRLAELRRMSPIGKAVVYDEGSSDSH